MYKKNNCNPKVLSISTFFSFALKVIKRLLAFKKTFKTLLGSKGGANNVLFKSVLTFLGVCSIFVFYQLERELKKTKGEGSDV